MIKHAFPDILSFLSRVVVLTFFLQSFFAFSQDQARNVKVGWRKLENSQSYEFQLSRNAKLVPLLFQKKPTEPELSLDLHPGTYYFRVRGVSASGVAGPWSDVQGFTVNPHPPRLLEPRKGAFFKKRIPKKGIRFRWESGIRGSRYRVEVKDSQGTLLERHVNANSFFWKPRDGGKYFWRVGFETAGGVEWSELRNLLVSSDAIDRPKPKVIYKTIREKDAQKEEDVLRSRAPEFWLIARGAQTVYTLAGSDVDKGVSNSSASGLAGVYSAEFRWRARRPPGQRWLLSGSFNFEWIRLKVSGNTFQLPRGYIRLFYTRQTGKWRLGPLLHFNRGKGAIFISNSDTNNLQEINTTVTRSGIGSGFVGVYEAAETLYLSTLGVLRWDYGGESNALPSAVDGKIGFEAGFGVVHSFAPSWVVEGRLRIQKEAYGWQPSSGGEASSFSATFFILDVGIGYRF